MIELLSNSAHVHLLLNHVPTVGFGLGLALFIVSVLARNVGVQKTSLGIFFLVAVVTIATYVSGNGAESILRGTAQAAAYPAGVFPAAIRAHEDAALLGMALMEITGFFAWLGLWQWRRLSKLPAWNTAVLLLLSLATFGLMAKTAELGGEIRHAEIRAEDAPIAAVTLDAVGRCTINMASGVSYRFERSTPAAGPAVAGNSTVPPPPANSASGTAGDILSAGECVYLSDGSGGKDAGRWYQAAPDGVYRNATPIGLSGGDIQKGETGPIRLLGRLSSDQAVSAPIETAGAGGSLSAGGTGLARDLGLFVSGRTWVWPVCETLHFVGLCMLFITVIIVDLRMLGMVRMVSLEAMYQLLPAGMLGFGLNLVTGMLFFIGVPGQYVHNVTFFWKIVFVLIGGLNVTYFMFVDEAWTARSGEDVPLSSKIAAASAIFIWVAVLYCGHMLPFIGNAF
jgi:hypothetical protein